MKWRILIPILLIAGCRTAQHPSAGPQYAGVVRKSEDISATISSARSDGKEVKALHRQSMSLIDRLDYKTTVLLQ